MVYKNIILEFLCLISAQPMLSQEKYSLTNKYELSIKELIQPTFNRPWSFGSAYLCQGNLVSIVQCLLKTEQGRIKIKGQMPEKYLDLKLNEPDLMGLQEALVSGGRGRSLDSLSLVHTAIALLEQTYHFKVTSIVDTVEVWCLQVANTTKLVRYDERRDGDNRGCGTNLNANDWESIGMLLYYLCAVVGEKANVIVYDETNETGSFTFNKPNIPMSSMNDFTAINTLLETYYGLHFIKRKQVEPLKLIEFR